MTKRQLIDQIVTMNRSAEPAFLARFSDDQLDAYLQHLRVARTPRPRGDASRYRKYFANCPTIPVETHEGDIEHLPESDELDAPADWIDQPEDFADGLPDVDQDLTEAAIEDAADAGDEPDESSLVGASTEAGKAKARSSFAESEEDSEAWLF